MGTTFTGTYFDPPKHPHCLDSNLSITKPSQEVVGAEPPKIRSVKYSSDDEASAFYDTRQDKNCSPSGSISYPDPLVSPTHISPPDTHHHASASGQCSSEEESSLFLDFSPPDTYHRASASGQCSSEEESSLFPVNSPPDTRPDAFSDQRSVMDSQLIPKVTKINVVKEFFPHQRYLHVLILLMR